ncbi:hypothetical protein B0H19DRAFT_1084632 [Mycena capillaripes]|nr:hypothetical protein B0H19DRAFT_1084632 [Mycena capillaripes]
MAKVRVHSSTWVDWMRLHGMDIGRQTDSIHYESYLWRFPQQQKVFSGIPHLGDMLETVDVSYDSGIGLGPLLDFICCHLSANFNSIENSLPVPSRFWRPGTEIRGDGPLPAHAIPWRANSNAEMEAPLHMVRFL